MLLTRTCFARTTNMPHARAQAAWRAAAGGDHFRLKHPRAVAPGETCTAKERYGQGTGSNIDGCGNRLKEENMKHETHENMKHVIHDQPLSLLAGQDRT